MKGDITMNENCEKEKYETPVMEIIEIDAEDIIFASDCRCDTAEPE